MKTSLVAMVIPINLDSIVRLSLGDDTTQIQNSFDLLISDLIDYLDKQPQVKNIKLKYFPEKNEKISSSNILDLGVDRIQKNNTLVLEIYEKNMDFLPFILLREAFYSFIPNEVKQNEMVKVYINQIVENQLEKLNGYKEWHKIIRDAVVDRNFLVSQLDKLSKFFKIKSLEEQESPIQFFINEIYENALVIGKRNIPSYYNEIFEKYTYKTSKSLYNEEIIRTLQILFKLFQINKSYVNLSEYQNLYKQYIENKKQEPLLSLNKFYDNLLWINKFTSIAPSYDIVTNLVGLFTIHCELIFNPLLEIKKVKKLVKNLPFVYAPRILENTFAYRINIAFVLPEIYLKDLLSYFNKLLHQGYLIKEQLYLYEENRLFLNLNYFLDIENTTKIIDPLLRRYNKDFECEHLIKYPSTPTVVPLSIFQYTILDRIKYYSVTGLTFDKRIETLNAIKEDIENEYRKQLTYAENFKKNFKLLIESNQYKKEFLSLLKQNQVNGLVFLHDILNTIIIVSNLIKNILKDNQSITNIHQFKSYLNQNSISNILEDNLFLQNELAKKFVFNEILPKYFSNSGSFKKEIEKYQLFFDLINSCYNLKLLNIKSIVALIQRPKLITEINKTKEERLRRIFKFVKSYSITNQRIESTIDDFLNHNPPIIVPLILNTILASPFAKFYPATSLKDTPEIRNKLEKLKSYFPRLQTTFLKNLKTGEHIIHLFPYSVNVNEKVEFYSSLYNLFKDGLISSNRNFWRGTTRTLEIEPKDFYDYDNKEFFYSEDFFEQIFLYSQKILGKKKLERFTKQKSPQHPEIFWNPSINIESFVNNEMKRFSLQKVNLNSNLIKELIKFRKNLDNFLLDQEKIRNVKTTQFFINYVKMIRFLPAFRKFGLGQYYMHFLPFDWIDLDLKMLFTNTFQTLHYPAQIDQQQPVFISYLFPYRTPNKAYLNWLIKSKRVIQEYCLYFVKKYYEITQFDNNLTSTGWYYSSNRYKIHIQNVLFNPNYSPHSLNIREFNMDKYSENQIYGPDTPEFKAVSQIYAKGSIDLKSYLGTNKYNYVNAITSLLEKQLIFPYINFKNLGFHDKILILLPDVKKELEEKIVMVFNFFNVCRIYEIEGEFYFYGLKDIKKFETGFMIEIWFPKCELDEFFDVFDLLFEYLEINQYLILTDLVQGKTVIKKAYGNSKFLDQYNPLINLRWNSRDKIWMNHKMFNERFEPIYPDLFYGSKREDAKFND